MIFPVSRLEAGMVLEKAVHDLSGRLLLAGGEVISEKHLRIFRAWGVVEAAICDKEAALRDTPLAALRTRQPERYHAAESKLQARFRRANREHPLMTELYACLLARELGEDYGE